MSYTVKQLAGLAGVSVRTLHFYDQIGLLRPAAHGQNGYRYYGEEDLLRLQQILFFKELDFSLAEIREIMDRPDFDVLRALQAHRGMLHERAGRLNRLIHTVDRTIAHVKGKIEMRAGEYYEGFSEEKQQQYREEIRARYGDAVVRESEDRWNSYAPAQQEAIKAGLDTVLRSLYDHMAEGDGSPAVQELVRALHGRMGFFYECSLERFRGLGRLYNEHPDFIAMYETKYGPGMAAFLERAIALYCDRQEAGR
jgi:DNA-binding transcriptional MerR regulator